MARKLTYEEQPWCVDPETKEPIIHKGLEGICVTKSELSFIDGFHSKLYIRGYSIEDLATKSTFEETAYLIIYGKLPTRSELNEFDEKLRDNRELPDSVIQLLKMIPPDTNPLEVLRTGVSFIGHLDPNKHDISREGYYDKAISVIAKMATITAYYHRIRNGKEIVRPNRDLPHAANFLYMFHGAEQDEDKYRAMDIAFILYTEHGMNASAFTSTVIASTMTDYYSIITGAIGALRGVLHGYANVKAMEQFKEIGSVDNVEKWFNENILTKKRRLMGFGHRVYKSYDPRARIFRTWAEKLLPKADEETKKIYEIAKKLEDIALKSPLAEKKIFTNTDYWSCLTYAALGIPTDYYTALFAMSRVVGWTAHALEYTAENRIIRPRQYYVGEVDKEYIEIDKRG